LGCVVRPVQKLQQLTSANGQFMLHYWRTEIVEGEPAICNDENSELRWLTVAQLSQLSPIFQEDVDLFKRLVAEEAR
jgi:8-oxo-dGTP diphosphatase